LGAVEVVVWVWSVWVVEGEAVPVWVVGAEAVVVEAGAGELSAVPVSSEPQPLRRARAASGAANKPTLRMRFEFIALYSSGWSTTVSEHPCPVYPSLKPDVQKRIRLAGDQDLLPGWIAAADLA
jgi:hypothetical protein